MTKIINNKPSIPDNNQLIISEFEKLKKQIAFDMDYAEGRKERLLHQYRWDAVEKVISIIKKLPYEIKTVKQVEGIKGIGKRSLDRIDEILKTGKLSEIKSFPLEYQKYVDELQMIHGIGRRRAFELVTKYAVKSIEDLKALYVSGEIDLPESVIKSIKFLEMSEGCVSRSEIEKIEAYLCDVLLSMDPELLGRVCGSYRREKPYSNDIDFLVIHPNYKNLRQLKMGVLKKNYLEILVDILIEERFIVYSLTDVSADTLYMGFCKYDDNPVRRIDIRFIPYDSYYTALLYFTGSREFNIQMRRIAKKLGYHLSEYELTDDKGNIVPINSEKQVFDILGMEYVPPNLRD